MKINKSQHITKKGIVKRNPGKVNTYLEHKQKVQKDIDNFPIEFAFNEEQRKEALKKLGTNEVVGVFSGGIIRKSDKDKFIAMLQRHITEHKEMMKNKSYVYNMFRYELANHEYGYTHDDEDTLNSLGLTRKQVENTPLLREQLEKAKRVTLNNVRGL